ncbi:hypothetical protein BZG06_05830 [Salinivibrio kushneri]|uniref:Uncharacterized protein n=1 Tax=Salinivibrio kushneri TaxID=1908198 RepID=A0AB36K9Q6_9GAMM|nr:hypothetical protein [Salinivibrio kushneri]OOE45928.1 hypothetical protein BZG09_02465 [Salinivibrio kushneri]OOE46485.1 hypothetical protein BZG06_05830 [Salinivibrio kushneri]
MNVGNVGQSQAYHQQTMKPKAPTQPQQNADNAAKDTKTAKAAETLSAAEAAKESKDVKATKNAEGVKKPEEKSSVESFTYGALGMDHPDKVKENDDAAYGAGQFLSALGTIGTILAVVV